MDNFRFFCVTELLAAYRAGELSPRDAVAAAYAGLERIEPKINAFCHVAPREDTARLAAESEARWAENRAREMEGVPITVKDAILARGWPTLRGSRTADPKQAWEEDAPAVARLREAGAIILGKTTTPEFGWKGVTDSPLSGITRNPWNLHEKYDLLLAATLAVAPFEAGRLAPEGYGEDWTAWTPFTYPFNLTGQPAASVPCGFVHGDRPVGLQIVGAMYQDALVLRAAQAFQSARPGRHHPEI